MPAGLKWRQWSGISHDGARGRGQPSTSALGDPAHLLLGQVDAVALTQFLGGQSGQSRRSCRGSALLNPAASPGFSARLPGVLASTGYGI